MLTWLQGNLILLNYYSTEQKCLEGNLIQSLRKFLLPNGRYFLKNPHQNFDELFFAFELLGSFSRVITRYHLQNKAKYM